MALRGDLTDAPPAELLARLADQQASGALAIDPGTSGSGDATATVHLRDGTIYAASLAGGTFSTGTRLITSHALDAGALSEALAAQRADLTEWRLGEILVRLGHVHADVVERISTEQILEIATEALGWRGGSWRFRPGERSRAMLRRPLMATEMLERAQARNVEWRALLPAVGGRHAPVVRTAATVPIDSARELLALLRSADEHVGRAGLQRCSHAAGLSLLEGARLAASARAVGLIAALPAEERLAVGNWSASSGQASASGTAPMSAVASAAIVGAPSSAGASPAAAGASQPALPREPGDGMLASTSAVGPSSATGSYALNRLLELEGPVGPPATARAVTSPAVGEPAAPPLEAPVSGTEDDGDYGATVLDLDAARAARIAEIAAIEEAAIAAALAGQLAREQNEREAEERAVADALRAAATARHAVARDGVVAPPAAPAGEHVTVELVEAGELVAAGEQVGIESAQAGEHFGDAAAPGESTDAVRTGHGLISTMPSGAAAGLAGLAPLEPQPVEAAFVEPHPDELTASDAPTFDSAPAPASDSFLTAATTPDDPASAEPTGDAASPGEAPSLTAGERLGLFSSSRDPLADTASLLRELSSLGDEDGSPAEHRQVVRAPAAGAHVPPKPADKKRKGLFSR